MIPLGPCRDFGTASDLTEKNRITEVENAKPLVSCVLDTCTFSSGMISKVYVPELTYGRYHASISFLKSDPLLYLSEQLVSNLNKMNQSIITLHANYISGNMKKMARMQEYGFWLALTDSSGKYNGKCKSYKPVDITAGDTSEKMVTSKIG